MNGGNQSKKLLHFLARPIVWPGAKIFIQKTINHTWAPSATSKRLQINTGKRNRIRSRSRTRPIPTIYAVRRHQSFLPQDSGSNRNILHRPKRKVPSYMQQGNKYILFAYHYDSNTIHAEPLKTRSALDLKTAYQKLHRLLTNRGLKLHLHILDNECPNFLQKFMREVNKNFSYSRSTSIAETQQNGPSKPSRRIS